MSRSLFDEALWQEAGITDSLAKVARSIYQQESGSGRNTKTSNRGAVGGMQVMPGTFREVADKDWDINDPVQNIRAGLRYLKKLDLKAQGDPALLAAGYYGGPGGLEKARKGIAVKDPMNPHAPDTLQYGQQVVARLEPGAKPSPRSVYMHASPAQGPAIEPVGVAAPATGPAIQPMGVAAVPLPPELVAYLAARGRVPEAPAPAAQDAWLRFLDGMRESRSAGATGEVAAPAVAVEPQQLNWGGPPAQAPMQTPTPVDFSAFGVFGGFAPRRLG